jgi:RND superfamily putative drug exporter
VIRPVGDDRPVTAPLYAIGRFCSRHHWLTIGVWVVLAVALVIVGQAGDSKTNDNLTLPGTGSTEATEALEENLPQQAYGSNPLVFKATAGRSLTAPEYADAIDQTVKRLNAIPDVNSAVNPLTPAGAAFLSEDRSVAYVPVVLGTGPGELTENEAQRILDAGEPAEAAGLEVSVGSYVGQALSKPDTGASDAIGIAAAIVILLFAFGTATAMVLPIFSAVLGLACALSIIRMLEPVVQVPSVASTLATMIGLGVGIDYALFIVTRHKLQLADGMELRESIARATATAGGAVVFAGFTVVIALCSLAFAGIPLVSTLGFTAAIAVVVAVSAATTLLPAMLGALGPRINSLRVQLGKGGDGDEEPRGWTRWAGGVAARPWRSAIAALAVLVVLALPIFQLELGQNDISALPKSTTARQAYDGLTEGFGPGVSGPLLVASEFRTAAEAKQVLPKLEKQVAAATDVAGVSEPTFDKAGTFAVFTVISSSAPWADETVDLVEDLRDTAIPQALKGTDGVANVGGQTAGYIDLATQIGDKLPLMIGIVVGLSFVVLLLAFRSLLIPLKAAAIMVCVFTSFVLNGNPLVKEFGVGLAVAIAIDATLVRCLLVPAVMVLLGRRAWWLPRWLGRLVPQVSIEGEKFFAERDAAQAQD